MSARKGKQEVFDPSDHPMVTVFYPEIPPCPDLNDTSTSLEREAAALIYMCLFVPHRGDPKGGHATWMDALRAPEAQMHMRRALKAHKSNAQCRQECTLFIMSVMNAPGVARLKLIWFCLQGSWTSSVEWNDGSAKSIGLRWSKWVRAIFGMILLFQVLRLCFTVCDPSYSCIQSTPSCTLVHLVPHIALIAVLDRVRHHRRRRCCVAQFALQ
jgi:hypothetical protein